jgi:hypothetical protein
MNDDSFDEDVPLGLSSTPMADAADQAWISGLLASLRQTPAEIPSDIATRLDQALAAEQREPGRPGTSEVSKPVPARNRNTRWLAVAAASLVFIGGASIFRQATSTDGSQPGSSVAAGNTATESTSALSPESSLALANPDPQQTASNGQIIVATDQVLTRTTVASGVSALLATSAQKEPAPAENVPATSAVNSAGTGAGAGGAAGSSAGGMDVSSTENSTSAAPVSGPAPTESFAGNPAWNDCLVAIAGANAGPVDSVITGIVFEGRNADILIRPVPGDEHHLDLWVVAAGCTSVKSVVLDHQVIPATG